MSETTVPAAEAEVVQDGRDPIAYELAFHVLPTVAEGEVPAVVDAIKNAITRAGGAITSEEAPAHFTLAYEVEKYLEGRNRRFGSAYFGWVRFTVEPTAIAAITEAVEGQKELLRYLLVKLTKVEEANPFYFHESIAEKRVETIEEAAAVVSDTEEPEVDADDDATGSGDQSDAKDADTDTDTDSSTPQADEATSDEDSEDTTKTV